MALMTTRLAGFRSTYWQFSSFFKSESQHLAMHSREGALWRKPLFSHLFSSVHWAWTKEMAEKSHDKCSPDN
jgi:hypothetical protein